MAGFTFGMVASVAHNTRRHASHDCVILHVTCDHCASPDESALPDGDSAHNSSATANRRARPHTRLQALPIAFALQAAVAVQCLGISIVDEHDAVSNKHAVIDCDPRANECVTGYFAVLSDGRIALNLHKCTNFRAVSYPAPVQIHEVRLKNSDILSDA